jgi:hypothetical protein
MATVKAKLESLQRILKMIERRWVDAIRELGSAYSEAYMHHSSNLPKQLPPDAHVELLGKVISSVTGAGAAVLNPAAAAVVATALESAIESVASKIGSYPDPGDLGEPNIDTPQKYENGYHNYISRIFGRLEKTIHWYLGRVDGLIKNSVTITHEDVDQLIDIINNSPIVYAPANSASWNIDKKLEIAMETAMWAQWVLKLGEGKGELLKKAAQLDMSGAQKRMQELNLFQRNLPFPKDHEDRARLEVAILMLKWAKQYKPSRPFIGHMPNAANQTARFASNHYINQTGAPVLAARELRRVVFEGVA